MIQDSVNKVIYEGNGLATEFPYPFEITKNTDVKVLIVSPEGIETLLTNDYYVDVEKKLVAYPAWVSGEEPANADEYLPLADGYKLVVYREAEYTQEIGLFDQYPFKTLETMIDKATILIQQLKDETNRAMKLSVAIDESGVDLTIPHSAGQSFRWSDDGKSLETTDDPARVQVNVQGWLNETTEQAKIATEKAIIATNMAQSATESKEVAVKSATSAQESEANAKASETASAKSASEALASQTASKQSETYSAKSAMSASSSASIATQMASEASQSATNAKASETNAGTSETNAKESEELAYAYALHAEKYGTSAGLQYVVISSRERGEDEPTYGLTDGKILLSDGTLADDATIYNVLVEGKNYKVTADKISITIE